MRPKRYLAPHYIISFRLILVSNSHFCSFICSIHRIVKYRGDVKKEKVNDSCIVLHSVPTLFLIYVAKIWE